MNIQINSNAFTKLNKMIGLSNVNIEMLGYHLDNNCMKGEVKIFGEFYSNEKEYEENNGLNNFENIIPFEVVFTKGMPVIKSVEICKFEYYELAGRGVETTFDINVEYDLEEDEERVENITVSNSMDEVVLLEDCSVDHFIEEEVKTNITNQIDFILTEKLKIKDDNFLEIPPRNSTDHKGVIKVIYYDEKKCVKDLCDSLKLSYEEVLEENQKYAFSDNHRIIIRENNEYRK